MADEEESIDQTLDNVAEDIASREQDDTVPAGTGNDTVAGAAQPDPLAEMPKSWAKEYAEVWSKLPKEAREIYTKREQDFLKGTEGYRSEAQYAKMMREVVTPYQALLDAQGIKDHSQAVRFLLNAHYQLSSGQPQERMNYFARLAKTYGLDVAELAKVATSGVQAQSDPAVQALQSRLDKFEGAWSQEQQARFEAQQASTRAEVEAFASDKGNPYFEEVADDIAALIRAYPRITLKEAYDRAVWANPVTRAKEQTRLAAESEAALRNKAKEQARKAGQARGTTIRGRDSERPAEAPKGTMDDTLRETLATIKERT